MIVAATAAVPAIGGGNPSMFRSILEASQTEKKGLMLYVKGQAIGGLVVKIDAESVELRNREYGRIVVRLESIDAAAMA
ncbi:MAG: hypothetical protein ABSF22_08185 [Bryobacteraceae bacterium]|jgi:hypothetical protein